METSCKRPDTSIGKPGSFHPLQGTASVINQHKRETTSHQSVTPKEICRSRVILEFNVFWVASDFV